MKFSHIGKWARHWILALSSLTLSSSMQAAPSLDDQVKTVRELCTLYYFTDLQLMTMYPFTRATTLARELIEGKYHEDMAHSLALSGQGLAEVYSGFALKTALEDTLQDLYKGTVCKVSHRTRDSIGQSIQMQAYLATQHELPRVSQLPFHSDRSKIMKLMEIFTNKSFAFTKRLRAQIYQMAHAVEVDPTKLRKTVDRDEIANALLSVSDRLRNPLYWDGWILALPTSPKAWNWHARSLPKVRKFHRGSLQKIKRGSFDGWWHNS